MLAFVYKSLKKADTYLYLATRDDFGCLPEPLRAQLGSLQFVLEVALTPERPLFGHQSGKFSKTHWIAFLKPNTGNEAR